MSVTAAIRKTGVLVEPGTSYLWCDVRAKGNLTGIECHHTTIHVGQGSRWENPRLVASLVKGSLEFVDGGFLLDCQLEGAVGGMKNCHLIESDVSGTLGGISGSVLVESSMLGVLGPDTEVVDSLIMESVFSKSRGGRFTNCSLVHTSIYGEVALSGCLIRGCTILGEVSMEDCIVEEE